MRHEAMTSPCAGVPSRPPRLLDANALQQVNRSAEFAYHTFQICHDSTTECDVVQLKSPFTKDSPALPAQGLTALDQRALQRQFWWQWHVELAPRPFGWLKSASEGTETQQSPRSEGDLARLRAIAGLYHTYAVGVGRVLSDAGAVVELCDRCAWEGAIYVPPNGSRRGVRHIVDWRTDPEIVLDPPKRSPAAITSLQLRRFYDTAGRRIWSHAKLLVLVQRFSSDYGHFLTETLPRLTVSLPALRTDPALTLVVDCAARFVLPWLQFIGGIGNERVLCKRRAAHVVHADCMAFARFTTPFTAGWRLGLERVRQVAYEAAGEPPSEVARQHAAPARRLVLWADRDLGPSSVTVHRVRHVVQTEEIVSALAAALPQHKVVTFLGSHSSPSKTVRLFSRAAAVIGPSGSALHNVVFARPGALIIELLPSDLSYAAIWQDAAILGLQYRAMHIPGFTCATNASLVPADVQRLVKFVARKISGHRGRSLLDVDDGSGAPGASSQGVMGHLLSRMGRLARPTRGKQAMKQAAASRDGDAGCARAVPAGRCPHHKLLGFVPQFGLSNR